MKIGYFAHKHSIEVSTLRHYMDLGLLAPGKQGAQYCFNRKDTDELNTIKNLKQMGLSLKDILNYINIQRSYNMDDPLLYEKLFAILKNRESALLEELLEKNQEMALLKAIKGQLNEHYRNMHQSATPDITLSGIPITLLQYLECPFCHSSLNLNNASIVSNSVMQGDVSCACGYFAKINNGILLTNPDVNYDDDPSFNFNYFGDVINPEHYRGIPLEFPSTADPGYLTFQHRGRVWMDEYLSGLSTNAKYMGKKIILMPDIASYFLYYTYFKEYYKDALIIVIGLSHNSIYPIYEYMQSMKSDLQIAYIVSPDLNLPFKSSFVDMIIDYNGFLSMTFFMDFFALHKFGRHLSSRCEILGVFDSYADNTKTLSKIRELYPQSIKNGQTLKALETALLKENFQVVENLHLGDSKTPGSFFEYHHKSDCRSCWAYLARKRG